MAFKKSAASAGPRVWTVAELGAFYTEHRSELLAHANRVLKDSAKAEEITQDALIKFMLAAPELESNDHALSYLHRTIENLCIDLFRFQPSLDSGGSVFRHSLYFIQLFDFGQDWEQPACL